jgi:uncharacterized protein YndB with AHSA1/START domain
MSEVRASIDIDAPLEKVWATVMDPNQLEQWVTIHRGLLSHSDDRMEQVLCLRGAKFKVRWELTTHREPFHAQWEGRGPARSHAETEYRLSDNGNGGTRFDYRNDFHAPLGPVGALVSRALVGGMPEREAKRTLEQLRARLEKR